MVSTLLFDLGGVIMDIRRERAVEALEALGMADANDFLGDFGQKGPFLALERGEIGVDEFRAQVRRLIPNPVSDRQLDDAFIRFLIGIPVERLRKLEELHRSYRIYMLSNTNPLMWDAFILNEFEKDGHSLGYYFDGWVTSFEAKCYKPDAEIFECAEKRFGLNPAETLFLDDSPSNCRAAEQLGFQTAWVKPGTEFIDYIL